MLITLLFAFAICYAVQMIWLRLGLDRSDADGMRSTLQPFVSIIVAARDEEEFIGECVQSLLGVDYPAEKLEIIVVNDGSTDRTPEIVNEISSKHPQVRLLNSVPGKDNLLGKTNAVAQGIEVSQGEILMFTDADCRVSPSWVSVTVGRFVDGVDIVGGFTILETTSAFDSIQAIDWMFLFSLASSMSGWRQPLSVIGNNLSVRRKAYDATGGFSKIPFSVTEDYALVQAIVTRTPAIVDFPLDKRALVVSRPCRNLRQLFRQKQRWGVGGLDMVFRGFVITAVGWWLRLFLLVCAFAEPLPAAAALTSMMCVDLFFLWKGLGRFGRLRELRYFLHFEAYFTIYMLLLPFIAILSKNVVWKKRTL